jgi:hypothetical protein
LRRLIVIAWVLPALLAAANTAQARQTERDSVVSYFRDHVSRTDSGSGISSCEWHVYDPARRVDRLLLTLPGRAQVVQWDTTITSVCFTSSVGFNSHSIYRCDWRFGARPRLVGVLLPPKGSTDYWFNTDSARWQASLQWPVAGDTLWRRELWQADRRGREWRCLRGDSVIVDPVDGPEEWAVAAAMRREPGVWEPGAQQDLDRLSTEVAWFDTSTVRLYAGTSRVYPDAYWYFLPFRAAPGMGLAFRWRPEDLVIGAPIFVVDLGRHTKRLLSSSDPESWCGPEHFAAERRGYAFASFCFDGPRIVDVHTGEIVFEGGPDTRDPTWVLAPLPH